MKKYGHEYDLSEFKRSRKLKKKNQIKIAYINYLGDI